MHNCCYTLIYHISELTRSCLGTRIMNYSTYHQFVDTLLFIRYSVLGMKWLILNWQITFYSFMGLPQQVTDYCVFQAVFLTVDLTLRIWLRADMYWNWCNYCIVLNTTITRFSQPWAGIYVFILLLEYSRLIFGARRNHYLFLSFLLASACLIVIDIAPCGMNIILVRETLTLFLLVAVCDLDPETH